MEAVQGLATEAQSGHCMMEHVLHQGTEASSGMDTDFPKEDLRLGVRAPIPHASVVRDELTKAVAKLSFCELAGSAQWAAELCMALPSSDDDLAPLSLPDESQAMPGAAYRRIMLAKSHFQMREYSRAAFALQQVKEPHRNQSALFLKLYSLYMSGEKRKEEEAIEVADPVEKCQVKNVELKAIEEQLAALHKQQELDGLTLYLYGMTLLGLEQKSEARQILLKAVCAFPCNWSAWLDIISICSDLNDVTSAHKHPELALPDHWMVNFFEAALCMELQRNEDARQRYVMLKQYFPDSSYILSQVATCCYNVRNFDISQQSFDEMRKRDPYKLTSLDTYSNILYVKEQSAALSHLARQAIRIDKYTPEACCIIGNYYSLKGEHEKSVTYFQRALCLNRNFTPAWILMGHEFMEMKNTPAAIDAYRTAVNINQRDYRAWYGLGQTYELLNLHFYALFYYRRAMMLRPEDARMWCAMAQCYESMERKAEALRCYEKAHRHGDRERMALPKLARLHRDLGDRRRAAAYYAELLNEAGAHAPGSSSSSRGIASAGPGASLSAEAVEALRFLMVFHRDEGRPAECEACAARLLDTAGPEKDEAKAALRDLRAVGAASGEGMMFGGH